VIPLYDRLYQITPHHYQWFLLLSDLHYAAWERGEAPLTHAIEQLEQRIQTDKTYPSAPLRLAELQLEVIRQNGWTPGLLVALRTLTQEAHTPFTKSLCHLRQGQPIAARELMQKQKIPEDP